MTPLQSTLLTELGLPAWQCIHPERLPHAPAPAEKPVPLLIVEGEGVDLPMSLMTDLARALALADGDCRRIKESDWRQAANTNASAVLGFNLTGNLNGLHWAGALPLTVEQKRRLWSCLCSLNIAR